LFMPFILFFIFLFVLFPHASLLYVSWSFHIFFCGPPINTNT
jgi:hypothetical protein